MTIIKSYTDLSQSKKLAEILPIETADMHYNDWAYDFWEDYEHTGSYVAKLGAPQTICGELDIPCWSLAALFNILPKVQGSKAIIALDDNYITYPQIRVLHTKTDNLVDSCYEMILKLHEQNLL